MALSEERLHGIIESLLLISPDPVPVARLVEVIRIEDADTEESAVKAAIRSLVDAYAEGPLSSRGIRVEELASGLQWRTVRENSAFVRRFLAAKPHRLTKPSLETLSIIAYRQPCTKPEIESIRGVDAGAAIKNLLERELIKIVGKREEVGRPILYATSPKFLELFGLKKLNELPSLREYHELDEAHQQEVDDLTSLQELAAAASFLVDEDAADRELETLDEAVRAAERVKEQTDATLKPADEAAPGPGDAG
jgi:segregation and condensation protein B